MALVCEGGSEECASGAADVLTENKMYCPKLHDIYQILKPREIEKMFGMILYII